MQKKSGALDLGNVGSIRKRGDYAARMKRISRIVITLLVLSFVIFLVIAGLAILKIGVDDFFSVVKSINPFYYSIAILLVLTGYVVRFPKWYIYMKKLGVNINMKSNFMIYLSMYSMDLTPGRWGRAIVSYTINRLTKVRFARTFPAVVADIFTDFLGFVILLLATVLLVHRYILLAAAISAILLVPFLFLYVKRPFEFIKRKFSGSRRLRSILTTGSMYFRSNRLLDRGAYAYSLAYTVPAMFLNGLCLYFVILAFGIPLNPGYIPTVIFIYATATMFGMVSGVPGALGVTDAALLAALVAFLGGAGISFGLASVITIFFRISTLWFVELFGFGALSYTFRYWKR